MVDDKPRCSWCLGDALMTAYHDEEWGVPVHDDRLLFEMLTLEGAQAGLNWLTILKKREHYHTAFDGFDVERIAAYADKDVERLMSNPGIVRNRLKIASTIRNAQAVIEIQREHGSFDEFIWNFVNNTPILNAWNSLSEIPARTETSDIMSKALKKRGFNLSARQSAMRSCRRSGW